MGCRILVVDDEQDFLDSIRRGLITAGYRNVRLESDPVKAAESVRRGEAYDVALLDVTMPRVSGVELLEDIKNCSPNTECIMVTAVNDAKIAVECIKLGAYDYLVKPISREDLVIKIAHAEERKRLLDVLDLKKRESPPELSRPEAFKTIVWRSPRVTAILREAELHAASDVPVLITGESGTGKELLARAIHAASPREQFPFIAVNMASINAALFEAEFFGHTKGAFTGAERDRDGYLGCACRGALFLDEIGTLPLDLQGKLLRVLQEREFAKLGSNRFEKANVRFIAATNENLDSLVAKGAFRKDLYYRLKGAWLHLPPLKERREDIPLLVDAFLSEFRPGLEADGEALSILLEYDYPGNVRELRSILNAAVNLSQGTNVGVRHLPDHLKPRRRNSSDRLQQADPATAVSPLAEVERLHILKVYDQTGSNKSQTSRLLGIGMNTLRRKLESYGVD